MNVAVQRQKRLISFYEPPDCDTADMDVEWDHVDRLAVKSRPVEIGVMWRRVKQTDRA
jgi:hypothetical protein